MRTNTINTVMKSAIICILGSQRKSSWSTGELTELTEDWKRTDIVPFFKKEKKTDLENYRPISLM